MLINTYNSIYCAVARVAIINLTLMCNYIIWRLKYFPV